MEASEKAIVKEMVRPNVDAEARWIKKVGKLRFGYKRHTVTDENGMVLSEETTAANESDVKHLETPLKKAKLSRRHLSMRIKDTPLQRIGNLKGMGLKSRIMHKGTRGHGITERQQRVNSAISKIRYKVERTFGAMRRWFGAGTARYVGLAKTHAQHIMESIAYNFIQDTRGNCVQLFQIRGKYAKERVYFALEQPYTASVAYKCSLI